MSKKNNELISNEDNNLIKEASSKNTDPRKKKRIKAMIALILLSCIFLTIGIVYLVSPIDAMPIVPIDDIVILLLSLATGTPLLIAGIKKKAPKNKSSECKNCGEEANGYKLCTTCYQEEQNRNRNKHYTTKTGKIVRSKSELILDEHLFEKGYNYTYEEELPLEDENGNIIILHPDFCIYDGDDKIYIEYWGFGEKNKKYTETKNEKLKLYERNTITLINLY